MNIFQRFFHNRKIIQEFRKFDFNVSEFVIIFSIYGTSKKRFCELCDGHGRFIRKTLSRKSNSGEEFKLLSERKFGVVCLRCEEVTTPDGRKISVQEFLSDKYQTLIKL